jgi:hypothetical protein
MTNQRVLLIYLKASYYEQGLEPCQAIGMPTTKLFNELFLRAQAKAV